MEQNVRRSFWTGWSERISALRNVPPLLGIVWRSAPAIVTGSAGTRLLAALIPIAMLSVSKRILDMVQARFAGAPLPDTFWWYVAAEFALAVLGGVLGRATGYFDSLLA